MSFSVLPNILNQEGSSFQSLGYGWKPVGLFTEMQTFKMMTDLTSRYNGLLGAQEEMAQLARSEMYLKLLRRMGFNVRRAKYAKRSNHLTFARAFADFYADYGMTLRYLKYEQARGTFDPPVE